MIKRLTLKARTGPYAGKEITVEAGQVVRVGRSAKANVATLDPYMSGEHFALECTADSCRVRDLNSRHGTFLNNQRITEAVLHEGDQLYVGETTLAVHIEEAAPPIQEPSVIEPESAPPPQPPEVHAAPAEIPFVSPPPASPKADPIETPPPVAPPHAEKFADPTIEFDKATRREEIPAAPPTLPAASTQVPETPALPPLPENPMLRALELSSAATPEGRLLNILREHHATLFALLDAARESTVPQLLSASGEEYQSLYSGPEFSEVAPYLVRLPASSRLLERLVREGWGQGWNVYLTCTLPLSAIRDYFRKSLMIKMPDGREFFSRFYDPRFFRNFLRGCTQAEADRYFGPINSYLMEAENPEILLQFTKSSKGVETKERLLLIPGT